MSDFKIEHTIPVPEKKPKYPFSEMKPGDSFFSPTQSNNLRSAAQSFAKNQTPPQTFTVKKEGEGQRCWRVS